MKYCLVFKLHTISTYIHILPLSIFKQPKKSGMPGPSLSTPLTGW